MTHPTLRPAANPPSTEATARLALVLSRAAASPDSTDGTDGAEGGGPGGGRSAVDLVVES